MKPEERARAGVFLAFQYPVEIPGVNSTVFLKAALNECRKARGEEELDAVEFLALVKKKTKLLELDPALLNRAVNEGFSGGEKKRNEIFQMAVLEPKLAILDETDSGLDIDALKVVAGGVNKLRRPDNATLVITHYQRLLNYIVPDFVHVLVARADRQVRRQGTGAGTGGARLRLAGGRRRRRARMTMIDTERQTESEAAAVPDAFLAGELGPGPSWLQAVREEARRRAGRNRLSHDAGRRNGASPTWRRCCDGRCTRRNPTGGESARRTSNPFDWRAWAIAWFLWTAASAGFVRSARRGAALQAGSLRDDAGGRWQRIGEASGPARQF